MAFEKFLKAVSSKPFSADGNVRGEIAVASATGLKVKQKVLLTSGTQPTLEVEVKRVFSGTLFAVGPTDGTINDRTDISAYLLADGAAVTANFQKRVSIPLKEIGRAVYEEEPTVAIRTVQVDQYGNILGGSGGVASNVNVHDGGGTQITSTTVGADQGLDVNIINSLPIEVNLDATAVPPDTVGVFGIDGGGTVHQILTDTAGRVLVSETPGTEADIFSNPSGDGTVALTSGPDVIVSLSHTSGTYHVSGWRYMADMDCHFILEVRDGAALVEILDLGMNNPTPGNIVNFSTPIEIAGVATRVIRVLAQRKRGGTPNSGSASAGINGFTT